MATIRRYFGVIGFFAAALFAPHAAQAACTNDVDCPDAQCGGQVCDWTNLPMTCKPAGTQPQGTDGWCTADTDCKCKGDGATCVNNQCTRTLPKGAGGGGASGSGGSAGSSAAGTSAAGTSSSTDSSSGSSGCSLAGGTRHGSLGLLGAACALGLIGARRRKRAVGSAR
jgi:hypothetical protein